MATTSLWRIKGYIGSVLLYAENPEKTTLQENIRVPDNVDVNSLEDVISYACREDATRERSLVSGINCKPETARQEMMRTKLLEKKSDGTMAYHGYQSFAEGEVTPDIAHEIGKKLANRLWGDYEVVIATHVDKESHIHNHFVVNTVSFRDGRKYHRTNEDYRKMREVSDQLCREYGLSVIRHPEGKRKNYSEWAAEKNGKPTYRGTIRGDIDRAIAASITQREFYELMESWGYEFKFYGKTGEPLQRPSLRPVGTERFFRFDRLGEDYSVEEIRDRILEKINDKDPFPEYERRQYHQYRVDHPPRPKAKGLAALYYYYCYELQIIARFPASVQRPSAALREDLHKLDKLDEQTRFLGANQIETVEDLDLYREKAREEVSKLTEERRDLRNELKRVIRSGDEASVMEVKKKISEVSSKMKKIKNTFKICDSVEERACQIQERLEALNDHYAERKENADELLSRSSRTGREDVPQRS